MTPVRVNLLCNDPGGVRSGCINIDPAADLSDARLKGDLHDLSPFVDDGEASEIVACDVIDRYERGSVPAVLAKWAAKLKKGEGELFFSFLDVYAFSRSLLSGEQTGESADALCHGGRACVLFREEVEGLCEQAGLEIVERSLARFRVFLRARRK